MKQMIGIKTIKMGVGGTVAILLAELLKLEYASSAGIIAILSIQSTRKESVEIALRRLYAATIALAIGSMIFTCLGYHAVSFGIYLILFIPTAARCKVTEGIVPASVLVTHLLGKGQVSVALLMNEAALMLVGILTALLINIYMPSLEKHLLMEKQEIEDRMFLILSRMCQVLRGEEKELKVKEDLSELESALVRGRKKAYQYRNNSLMSEKSLYEKYFEMRYSQYQVLLYSVKHFERFYKLPVQAQKVAVLTEEAALTVRGKKRVEQAMATLAEVRHTFQEDKLPSSRNEFENRAMLYQFLTDIEQFLYVKQQFKAQLSEKEKKAYKGYYH